jgi:beta-1,4-mannosyl-glycoprotein beta-1,4-N-acetylglucosaminyltransferase
MKIIDCFTFYNELDMLELRLIEMYDYVDYFVLVEATKTFVGNKKQLYYQDNKERYAKYNDKIIHIIVDDMPEDNNPWNLEHYQRRCIDKGISKLVLNEEDIIIIADIDEIIDTDIIIKIKNGIYNIMNAMLFALEQDMYYYNFNCINNNKWYHCKLLNYYTYKNIFKRDTEEIRMSNRFYNIQKGGWHLSCFGDVNFIINKIKNFSHQEFNNDIYLNDEKILNNIKNCKDVFNRNECVYTYIKIEDNTYLPKNYKYLHEKK